MITRRVFFGTLAGATVASTLPLPLEAPPLPPARLGAEGRYCDVDWHAVPAGSVEDPKAKRPAKRALQHRYLHTDRTPDPDSLALCDRCESFVRYEWAKRPDIRFALLAVEKGGGLWFLKADTSEVAATSASDCWDRFRVDSVQTAFWKFAPCFAWYDVFDGYADWQKMNAWAETNEMIRYPTVVDSGAHCSSCMHREAEHYGERYGCLRPGCDCYAEHGYGKRCLCARPGVHA